ncbi:hypothetical protein EC973_002024 [Apophysomyces ossiformis]|uniref:VLRF1 domain-containing protein n=1 Tax=Apophysomyces ossiformis TaxID=679940 RepID=A0A8H7BJK4_9FUNG|nr:hypothetical protein EC973_002024 [Apophysomyces ossiformis]
MSAFDTETITKRPLSVLHLPPELLDSLIPADRATEAEIVAESQEQALRETEALNSLKIEHDEEGQLTCRTCNVTFELSERDAHRKHFSTDWHRYNIKRGMVLKKEPVSLSEFEILLEEMEDSLSGSDTEDDDDTESDTENDRVAALVGKQEQQETDVSPDVLYQSPLKKYYSAFAWFNAKVLPESIHLGIYEALFSCLQTRDVKKLQERNYSKEDRVWTIIMVGGGHFAGAVIDVKNSKGVSEPAHEKQVRFITHKTFHRYTTRRKQGGSQSLNDSAKGNANSAGAMIRRHNEQALQQEIRELLSKWRPYIEKSELILVHAPSNNRKIVYDYDQAILNRNDPRVSSVPFTTRRPTLNEIKRVFLEFTTLKMVQVDQDILEAHRLKTINKAEKVKQQLENSRTKKKEDIPKIKPQRDINPEMEKLVELVKQGKTQVFLSYISKHTVDVSARLPSGGRQLPTLLHIASNNGNTEIVSVLLRDLNADPTLKSDVGKTAYEIAKNKETRNVFRRCMCDMPDKWPWMEEARVPSPLTREAELEQIEKDRHKQQREMERKQKVEEERQKREEERLAKERAEAQAKATSSRTKFDPIAKALGGRDINPASMSPEARMRLEREKRARAAEARLRKAN